MHLKLSQHSQSTILQYKMFKILMKKKFKKFLNLKEICAKTLTWRRKNLVKLRSLALIRFVTSLHPLTPYSSFHTYSHPHRQTYSNLTFAYLQHHMLLSWPFAIVYSLSITVILQVGLPRWLSGKNPSAKVRAEDVGLIPGLRRCPGEGNGNPP